MASHIVKVLESKFITHDVKKIRVERPSEYSFIPGQATEVAINLPQWKDQLRPFTFTNPIDTKYLEFMIKIYRDHNGVTNKMGGINTGDELIIHDVFGTIEYKGKGTFIAAGTGITPFIAIFRALYNNNKLRGNRLIYVNKTSDDIIAGQELFMMFKKDFVNVLTRQNTIGFIGKRIDRNFLIENIVDFNQQFYVCGPESFVLDVNKNLLELGAEPEFLVFEQ